MDWNIFPLFSCIKSNSFFFLKNIQRLKLWPANRGQLYFTCDGDNCIYEGYVSTYTFVSNNIIIEVGA